MKKTFDEWKKLVDQLVFVLIGYHLDDLPDENYRLNYDTGLKFCDMGKIVVSNFETQFN